MSTLPTPSPPGPPAAPPATAPSVPPPPPPVAAQPPSARLLTAGDRWSMVGRLFLLQALWNYERMQGLGFAWALEPAVRRVSPDDASAARAESCRSSSQMRPTRSCASSRYSEL